MTVTTDTLDPIAREFIGIPFELHGRDRAGMDCLGLAVAYLDIAGIPYRDPWTEGLERIGQVAARGATELEDSWVEVERATLPGDLVVHPDGRHVSVYVGGGMVLTTRRRSSSCLKPVSREPDGCRVWRSRL